MASVCMGCENENNVEELIQIIKSLDTARKIRIYKILVEKRETTIPELTEEYQKKYNEDVSYQTIESALKNMPGLVEIIPTRPKKVRLKKTIDIQLRDINP